jgi:predicted ATPase
LPKASQIWELRAAISMSRRDQGKVQHARELLAPVYGWFTNTRDLQDAKALLSKGLPLTVWDGRF